MFRPAATPRTYTRIDDSTLNANTASTRPQQPAADSAMFTAPMPGWRLAFEREAGLRPRSRRAPIPTLRIDSSVWRGGVIVLAISALAALLFGTITALRHDTATPQLALELQPDGDILRLPDDCTMARMSQHEQRYVRFNGQYPPQWPAGLRLPYGCFKLGQGKLTAQPALAGDSRFDQLEMISFKCLVRGEANELLANFRREISAAGLQINSDLRSAETSFKDLGHNPGRFVLEARLPGQRGYPLFYVSVSLLDDMGGWTSFSGHYIYDRRQPLGPQMIMQRRISSVPLGG